MLCRLRPYVMSSTSSQLISYTPCLLHFSAPPPFPPTPLHPPWLFFPCMQAPTPLFQFTHPLPHLSTSPAGSPPLHFLIPLLYRDGFVVCLLDTVTSVLWGYVYFSLQESYVHNFTNFEPDTSFVFTISSVILANQDFLLWPILFFTMIFALGFNSQVFFFFHLCFCLIFWRVDQQTVTLLHYFVLPFHFVDKILYRLPPSVSLVYFIYSFPVLISDGRVGDH